MERVSPEVTCAVPSLAGEAGWFGLFEAILPEPEVDADLLLTAASGERRFAFPIFGLEVGWKAWDGPGGLLDGAGKEEEPPPHAEKAIINPGIARFFAIQNGFFMNRLYLKAD